MKMQLQLVLAMVLFLTSCSLERKIAQKMPVQSKVNVKRATHAIEGYVKRRNWKEPYTITSIQYNNDTTYFLLKQKQWEYKIKMDNRSKIVGTYVLLDTY
jgi:hypothetical protein